MTRAISWSASISAAKCARSAGDQRRDHGVEAAAGQGRGLLGGRRRVLDNPPRVLGLDARSSHVPIAAAITSHLDGVLLCSAWRRRGASSSGVHLPMPPPLAAPVG